MKKILTCVAMALLLVGCAKEYNDSGLRELISALDTRITALESNVQALQSAIGEGVFVAKVQEYVDPDTGKTIGVTVTYTNGDVKYFEITPKADYDGPVLGVIKNGAGQLVWAIDGVAIMVDDEYVTVYQTPVFSIDDDGNLWVSIDGQDPVNLGPVTSGGATLEDGIFTDIKVLDDKIVLTLSDNSTVSIPFAEAFKLNIDASEVAYSDLKPITIPYTVSAKTANTVVDVIGYNPLDFNVEVNEENIVITPLKYDIAAKMMAYADSRIGLTSIVALCVEPEGVSIVDTPWSAEFDYVAAGEDGTVTAHVVSNVEFVAKPEQDWVHVVEVKGTLHTISIVLDDNPTLEEREGDVTIYKKDDQSATGIMQIITILQGPGSSETGPANLSKKESANSYLVYAPGEYKFKTVKGNSEESVGTVAKAEILWESDNTTTAPAANAIIASVSVDGEFIVFSTPETLVPGNALIAAKDASDVILWSWHIWIPATEIVNGTFNAMDVPMMDRNLGALVPAVAGAAPDGKSIGMFYQWGRKDPFPGTASVSDATPIATNGTISLASEKQNYTPEESVQIPTVYIVTGGDSNKTWMVGTEAINLTLWGAEKTVYDPCPPGYVVAASWKNEGLTVDTTNKLLKVGDAVFPVAGYLDQGEYVKVGQRAYVWSSIATSADNNIAPLIIADGGSASVTVQRMSRGGNIRCVVANEGAIVPPTPTPGGGGDEPGDDTVDLSKDGSANCYIIPATSEGGVQYKFKAVKGNSSESAGTIATAEVLWETINSATAPEAGSVVASVEYADGYVFITMPETLQAGNALVGVKDAAGDILWSWHIWVPADEVEEVACSLMGGNILDRHLGALVKPEAWASADDVKLESFGLFYQWGRKDPFPGPKSLDDYPSKIALTGMQMEKYERKVNEAEGLDEKLPDVAWSIKHPTTYPFKSVWKEDKAKYSQGSCDWLEEHVSDLWNKDGNKTIYDPCPVGYKVPLYDNSLALWKKTDDNWTFDKANFYFKHADSDVVFPLAGYLDDSGGSLVLKGRAFIWSATEYSDAARACGIDVRTTESSKYYGEKTYKARGASVRCIAE
jgi:hypothetical protein